MLTRLDRTLTQKIKELLDKITTLNNKQEKIKMNYYLFNDLLISTEGLNFMNKYENFKKAIRKKLEEFYNESEVKANAIEWHMKIFKEPIRQEKEKAEVQKLLQEQKEHLETLVKIRKRLETLNRTCIT